MKNPNDLAKKLIDEFTWCATSSGHTTPLAPEVVKDIVKKHIELLMPYLEWIDEEFFSDNPKQELHKAALIEIDNL